MILDQGQILLAREIGAANTFLPGGHVEPGESAPVALRRELLEEIGLTAEVVGFLGAVENHWEDVNGAHAEINLLFAVRIAELSAGRPVISQEDHLEFLWAQPESSAEYALLPRALQDLVASMDQDRQPFWGSNYV